MPRVVSSAYHHTYVCESVTREYRSNAPQVSSPEAAAKLLRPVLEQQPQETLYALLLNAKNRVLQSCIIGIGTVNASLVHPRDIFRRALAANATAVIVAHNHPSGDPTPSREDVELTKRLAEAGRIIGIEVLDHVIIGAGGYYKSLHADGVIGG